MKLEHTGRNLGSNRAEQGFFCDGRTKKKALGSNLPGASFFVFCFYPFKTSSLVGIEGAAPALDTAMEAAFAA